MQAPCILVTWFCGKSQGRALEITVWYANTSTMTSTFGSFFHVSSCFFFVLTLFFLYYLSSDYHTTHVGARDRKNGPKQVWNTLFGHLVCFFHLFSCFFFVLTLSFVLFRLWLSYSMCRSLRLKKRAETIVKCTVLALLFISHEFAKQDNTINLMLAVKLP